MPIPIVNPNRAFQENVGNPTVNPTPTPQTPTTPNLNLTDTTGATGANVTIQMPKSGSIVDLLNSQGEPSSFASRQKLAQQYGIQGYRGTAKQNLELAQKYIQAHTALKEKPPTDNVPQARLEVQKQLEEDQTKKDPQASFFDEYAGLNPIMKTMYDMVQQVASPSFTQQSLLNEYNSLVEKSGIQKLQTDLLNIQNIMSGTEDDIRTEITRAGGFATESQVQALAAARNKVLLKQASYLQNAIQLKNDYIQQVMQFSKADRDQLNTTIEQKIGLVEKMASIQDTIMKNAQNNYQKIVDNVGYDGLAASLSPDMKMQAERLLGLTPGSLSDKQWLDKYKTFKQQTLGLKAQSLEATQSQREIANELARMRIESSAQSAATLSAYRSALIGLAQARTRSADATAVNSTIRNLFPTPNTNPINLYNNALSWFGSVKSAYSRAIDPNNPSKGPSDLALIDAAVKVDNGGQQVTEAQVNALASSIGFKGRIDVLNGKIVNVSGIIDDKMRKAILDTARENVSLKKKAAEKATDKVNYRLQSLGYDSNLELPSVIDISTYDNNHSTQTTSRVTGTLPNGTKVFKDSLGNIYDAQGNQYDEDGKKI